MKQHDEMKNIKFEKRLKEDTEVEPPYTAGY